MDEIRVFRGYDGRNWHQKELSERYRRDLYLAVGVVMIVMMMAMMLMVLLMRFIEADVAGLLMLPSLPRSANSLAYWKGVWLMQNSALLSWGPE